jgi:hypothetical protein
MPLPKFLNDDQVKIPVGGDFVPSGFIAPWYAQVVYSFFSEIVLAQVDSEVYTKVMSRKMGNGFRYYFKTQEEAKAACDAAGVSFAPQATWWWLAEREKVINFSDPAILERFSDPISFELPIATLRSKKHRHELHMIALPSAVAAMAKAYGYDNAGFDVSELMNQDAVFTDEFAEKMIGTTSGKYQESLLWKRRADLWKSLGEENPEVYNPIDAGSKLDTTSKKLSECLGILSRSWKSSVWTRLVQVPDPRVDATYGEDEKKRLSIPALYEIFGSEKDAKVAADAELKARAEREANKAGAVETKGSDATNAASHMSIGNGKQLPDAWKELPDDWNNLLNDLRKEYAGKPRPVVTKALKAREGELGATAEEIVAWL